MSEPPKKTCQYPLSDPVRGRPTLFCDKPAERGSPYCLEHEDRCWLKRRGMKA